MPIGKRVNLQWSFFHYNLASHLFLSLSSPLIFITLNLSPSTPGDLFHLPPTSVCLTRASVLNSSVFVPTLCLPLCSMSLLMEWLSYLWHTLESVQTPVNSLKSMPSCYSPRHRPNSAPLISIILWIFIESLLCAGIMKEAEGVMVSKTWVLLESVSESSAVGGGFYKKEITSCQTFNRGNERLLTEGSIDNDRGSMRSEASNPT